MKFSKHEIEWNPEKIQRIWDYYSSNPAYQKQYFAYCVGKYVANEILKSINIKKMNRIVDFSCGTGDLLENLIPYLKDDQSIFGTDVSQSSIDIVNGRFEKYSAFKGADVVSKYLTSWRDESFDLIISTEVVEHLDDTDLSTILNDFSRLLKEGGYLVITTPNNEDLDASKIICPDCGCIFHKWQHQRTWTTVSLKEEIEKYSFVTKKAQSIYWASAKRRFLYNIMKRPKDRLFYIGRKEKYVCKN